VGVAAASCSRFSARSRIECLPTEIPEFFEVDVTALDIHDAVTRRT
jgi:hypothetical protein